MFRIGVALLVILFVVVLGPGLLNLESSQALARDGRHYRVDDTRYYGADACAETSEAALTACQFAAKEEYNLALGRCENVSGKKQCEAEAREEFYSALDECNEQFDARQEVCELIGPGPYLPKGIKPSDFEKEPFGNEYFPLNPGTRYTYKNYDEKDEIQETIVVEVKDETREIEGIECRVVQDTVYEGDRDESGEHPKIEDTSDWYALRENEDGFYDVWYLGEIALNFEDGVISNIDGSWTYGVEGAKPGILMYGDPAAHEGETYRQEFALSEAEDVATIVEILTHEEFKAQVWGGEDVPGLFGDGPFLHTIDFAPLEPGVYEDKYYGFGVGNVLIVKPATDEDPAEMEVLVKVELTP